MANKTVAVKIKSQRNFQSPSRTDQDISIDCHDVSFDPITGSLGQNWTANVKIKAGGQQVLSCRPVYENAKAKYGGLRDFDTRVFAKDSDFESGASVSVSKAV